MRFHYDFVNQIRPFSFWLKSERLSFCQELSSRVADLLDVIMSIYAADRLSRRDFRKENTGQRSIHVRVGVREQDFWLDSMIVRKLKEVLSWMSEDSWSFEFAKRNAAPTLAESAFFLLRFSPEPPVTVALFSGGLDSLAGLATQTLAAPTKSYVLVSGHTQNRLAALQRSQVGHIRTVSREGPLGSELSIGHVAVPFGMHSTGQQKEEKGQRTRALVYLAIGIVAAVQANTDTLWVYENGIGAMNLPLNETQLGVDNYRGVHPLSLMMAEGFFKLVLGKLIHIKNPFLFHTKAEMCRALEPAGLATAVQHTVSCDSFPLRLSDKSFQCGYCTSCLLRRQSILAGELNKYDPGERYLRDVLTNGANVEPKRLFGLEVMRSQVYQLSRCLDSDEPWQSLIVSFPELMRTHAGLVERYNLDADETCARFVRLFRTYVNEWESCPREIASKSGCHNSPQRAPARDTYKGCPYQLPLVFG